MTAADKRDEGIDALRILCMIMIPILHILGHGGILYSAEPMSLRYELAWLLESAAFCSTNCYALISGYVSYGKRHKYANIIYLNFQVLFYTVITTGVFYIFMPEVVGKRVILQALFPFAFPVYWYYNAYFCMFFFMPFMNYLLERLDRPALRGLIFSIIAIYSVMPTLSFSDPGSALNGNSALWLGLLYFIGGYIKKYKYKEYEREYKYKRIENILIWLSCVILAWAGKYACERFFNIYYGYDQVDFYMINNTSPLILGAAVCLLNAFSGLKLPWILKKFTRFFAPLSFGVYLFHCEPLIWNHVLFLSALRFLDDSIGVMLLKVMVTALGIWFVGSLADWIRSCLFNLLHIRRLCVNLEEKIGRRLKVILYK